MNYTDENSILIAFEELASEVICLLDALQMVSWWLRAPKKWDVLCAIPHPFFLQRTSPETQAPVTFKTPFIAPGVPFKHPGWQYYIKTAAATSILATPCFIDLTRPLFNRYRGEWALLSFFVVIAPTEGHVGIYIPVHTLAV